MTIKKIRSSKAIQPLIGSIAALLLASSAGYAVVPIGSSATWNTNPVDGFWDNSNNWTPAKFPNSSTAVATFNQSTITNISFPIRAGTNLDSIVFNSGASNYNFALQTAGIFFNGAGIVNNSGKQQNFSVGPDSLMFFGNSASAGKNTVITVMGFDGGEGTSSGGELVFTQNSNAGQATLIATNGVPSPFSESSSPTTGGGIFFVQNAQGGQAAVQLHGNGFLDISGHNPGSVSIGSLSGDGFVFLGSNNLTVGGNNQNSIFNGSIQDGGEGSRGFSPAVIGPAFGTGGSLTKVGTGTLILGGVNTYTGNTYINGGALVVNGSIASPFVYINPGGALGGSGFIGGSVINNGLVSPGNSPGTLHINGNYSQSSNGGLFIQISSHDVFDRLLIGGSANLNGTLFVEPLNPSKLKKGEKFQILTAGGGVDGTFATVSDVNNDTLLRFKVDYGHNDVVLETVIAPFTGLTGLTPNQQSVANILDHISNEKDANKLISFLATEPINQLPADLDKLAAEEFTSIFTIGTSIDSVQSLVLQNYLDSLRSGSGTFSAGGLALNGFSVNYAGPIQFRTGVAGPNGDDGKGSKEVQQIAPAENRWGAFLTGTGQWVGVSDDFNARGYDVTTGGFTLGIDYKVCSHFAVGILAGYVGTGVDLNDGGRVFVNGGKLGLYATAYQNRQPAPPTGLSKDSSKDGSKEAPARVGDVSPGWYADLAVTGGYSSYDLRRSGLQGTARGDTDGGDLNVLVGLGYDFKKGNFTFGPTASFNYTYVGLSNFTESGSLAPLHFPSQSQESIRTAFGLKAAYDCKVGTVVIRPELRAAWQHEYGDSTYAIDSSFANAGGNFTTWGPSTGRDSFLLGAGFAVQFNERFSTYFYYDGELGRTRYDSHAVTGGVRVAF